MVHLRIRRTDDSVEVWGYLRAEQALSMGGGGAPYFGRWTRIFWVFWRGAPAQKFENKHDSSKDSALLAPTFRGTSHSISVCLLNLCTYEHLITKTNTFLQSSKHISVVNPNICSNVSIILFWNDTLHVSGGLSVHHQEFKTVHTVVKQTLLSAC